MSTSRCRASSQGLRSCDAAASRDRTPAAKPAVPRAAVTFKLTSLGAALLRSRGRLSVKVTTTANLPGATAVHLVKTITIRRPKPARRSVTKVSRSVTKVS